MTRASAVAGLVAIALVATGCSAATPKDASPVVVPTSSPSAPVPSATPTPTPTTKPAEEPAVPSEEPVVPSPSASPSVSPTTTPGGDGETGGFVIPDEEVLFTADELYSSEIEGLYADVEAADRSHRIGLCRSAAIIVGELTSSEIEERRESMAPDDVETLEDFVSLCQRVLAS